MSYCTMSSGDWWCGDCDRMVDSLDADFMAGRLRLRPCGHVATLVFKVRAD